MVHIYIYIYTVFKRKNIDFNIFCSKASSVELKFFTCYISLLSFIYIHIHTYIHRHISTDIYTHIYILLKIRVGSGSTPLPNNRFACHLKSMI